LISDISKRVLAMIERRLALLASLCGLSTAVIAGMTGCGEGMTPISSTRPPTLTSIAINSSTVNLSVGQTYQFTVTGTDSDGASKDVTDSVMWSSSNVAVVAVSASGLATATGAGSATITAVSSVDASKTTSASVAAVYTGVLTYHNDLARTGQNLNETILTPSNVNSAQFGKLFSYPVDGEVYAEPLYVANVNIEGQGPRNVVYVATEHDSVYAFDADRLSSQPLWHVSFTSPNAGIASVSAADVQTDAFDLEIGITGTPVIDPSSGVLYVVVYTKENGDYVFRLHALDITNGTEKLGGPVVIQASVAGTGDGNDGQGHVVFNPFRQLQRSGLLLLDGIVYVAFASHADNNPYHGWLLGYDARTLQQLLVYNDTPDGAQGGIWESGAAPAADANGNAFLATGNGTFDADVGGADFGDSILRLSAETGHLTVADFFTPFNQELLIERDFDLGSGGVMLLPDQPGPHPHLLVGGGKGGSIYLADRDSMGRFRSTDNSQIVESIPEANGFILLFLSSPAYWNSNVYVDGSLPLGTTPGYPLQSFRVSNGLLSSAPVSQTATLFGYPGAVPAVSANGSTNGIVWAIQSDGYTSGKSAVLHAYDATDVSRELYNSNQAEARDASGPAVKFTVPTVANGKVYVGTGTELDVYGLLSQ
jgi:Bacterial Ig-like domain (group 2)